MTKLIKRYPNRKLYDTELSTYVTLDEIESMVKDGEDVRILDHATHEDITHITLAHIIFENEKAHRSSLPLPALRGIIQSGEDFFQRLQQPVIQFREEFRKRAEAIEEGGKVLREFIEATQASMDEMQHRLDDRLRDAVDQLTHIPEMKREVYQIHSRLLAMEANIRRLEHQMQKREPDRPVTATDPYRDVPTS